MELSDAVFKFEYDGEDFTIPLDNGRYTLRGCEWRPEGQPEFVVVYVHGLGTFLTTKHDVIDVILQNGGAFLGCDHLGHGRSPGPRCSCTIEEICEETEQVIVKAHESFPDLPIFLFSHSMGSLASLRLIFEKSIFVSQNLRGAIIESPWISNSREHPIGFLDSFILMVASKYSPYSIISTGDEPYSPDTQQDFVRKVVSSPLFSPFSTPRLLNSAFHSITLVRENYSDWPSDLPVIFLQGGKDTDVNPQENMAWIKDVQESSAKDTVEYKFYPEASHNLFKTTFRPIVLQDMLDFINNHKQ